ncbi:MAG: PepSY domain-containing protein [Magnetospirillum sp.]|nr:PepSY domain-containing protein [Magnetospirillum sp.]
MTRSLSASLCIALALAAAPALADDDHERAHRAVQAGEVLPLRTVLDNVARDFPGDVIETELEEWHGRRVYEIKVISPEGNVLKLFYDARDGSLLKAKGRGTERGGRP